MGVEYAIVGLVILALLFDFLNGFHDAANAIATVVATRVLTPVQAVGLAAVFNLLGPLVFTTAVAKTVGKGIVMADVITLSVLAATLIGAILWNIITWWFGFPSRAAIASLEGSWGQQWQPTGGVWSIFQRTRHSHLCSSTHFSQWL